MKVDRLAIICVLSKVETHLNKETKKGGKALYAKYTGTESGGIYHAKGMNGNKVALYHVECELNTGGSVTEEAWNEGKDEVRKDRGGGEVGGGSGTLGIYLLVHSGGVDLEAFHYKKVSGLLEKLQLTGVTKLCLLACKGAFGDEEKSSDGKNMMENNKGNPSVLYLMCEDLATNGEKPKMAGWSNFVSVLPAKSPDKKTLKVYDKESTEKVKPEINYAQFQGKKYLQVKDYGKALTSSEAGKKEKPNQKVYYVWNDGVRCLDYGTWTDKTF